MPISKVYNMDCMEYMKSIPNNFFDLAVVDPPYGIGINKMVMGGRNTVKPDNRCWDDKIPEDGYFFELFRISKNQIIWGGNYFNLPPRRCFLIWDKGDSMYGRSFSECEYAWCSFDKSSRIFKQNPNDKNRIHPTQKPVSLYAFILKNFAHHGDKILDTHLGSGSSRIAAYKMGFDFYATEIDKEYFDAQELRFRCECFGEVMTSNGNIIKQTSIFDIIND